MHRLRRLLICFSLVISAFVLPLTAPTHPASAVEPDEILSDAGLEARARKLSAELRCLVCQNQSIDDSNAPLARDLRVLVRERLKAGDSDSQILDYVVARYGEFVLLRPRFSASTVVLWLSPLLILGVAIWLARGAMRPPAARQEALTEEDKARLAEILEEKPAKTDPEKTN
jgi:cytochrome c-type biogenesis protein CcmH